jgi:L-fuconolactonase
MIRVDAHQHFWRYDPAEYGWIDGSMFPLKRDFLPADAMGEMGAAGFDAAVAVQARQTIEETRWLLALADAHPFIVGVVGWVDLQSPFVDAELAALAAHPKLVGIRHIVQSESHDFLSRPAFRRGVARLAQHGLAYDILIHPHHLPEAVRFAEAFPAQRFVLDHLAKPEIGKGAIDPWRGDIERLAACPNVCAKLSGLVTEADWQRWTADEIRPYIDVAFECFGAARLMIGSDWPVCTLAGRYADVVGVVVDYVARASADERALVLGGTALRFWNLTVERAK